MSVDVSVIVTAYNVEHYINRAIDSCLKQEGVTLEVIAVDDASTDGTWQLLSGYADPRVKPLRLPANGGPGAARNAGLAKASGDWVAVLDGDDAFASGRLARCLGLARREKADIVVDNLKVCREADGREFPMFPPQTLSRLSPLGIAAFIKGTVSAKNNYTLGYLKPLFSHAFLKQHGLAYDPVLRIGEDYLLLLEALLLGARCVIDPEAGYLYTARKGSISYRLSTDNITRILQADEKLLARYTLDKAALIEQDRRTRSLKKEFAYTQLVNAIKQKDWAGCIKAVISHPMCVWLLWRPVKVRITRLLA